MMYDVAFGTVMRYGYGAAISYGLFLAIGIVTLVFNKIVGIGETTNEPKNHILACGDDFYHGGYVRRRFVPLSIA